MPYIITKKNGKRWDWPSWAKPLPNSEVEKFARDGARLGDCWTLVSPVTRRAIHVGACKRPTPPEFWGARFRDAALPAAPSAAAPPAQKPAPTVAGWWPFAKKKPKRNPMSKRIYMIRTKSGTYIPAGIASMQGARRRRRRRR